MTAQIPELLHYQRRKHDLHTEPLASYLEQTGRALPSSGGLCSALWRDYVGEWRVVRKRLYLQALYLGMEGQPLDLAPLFPDHAPDRFGRIFANWYTGELRSPLGALTDYEHIGWGGTYERYLVMQVVDGVVAQVAEMGADSMPRGLPWDLDKG